MTTWNYRILVHTHNRRGELLDQPYYAVHEVFYDKAMTPHSCTAEPVKVGGDSPAEIERQLSVMLVDIERPPIDFRRMVAATAGASESDEEDEDGKLELMQAIWGDQPSGPYDPTSGSHCAWEVFGRSGGVPTTSHIDDLVAARTDLCTAMDSLSSLRSSRRAHSLLRRFRIVVSALLDRIGL